MPFFAPSLILALSTGITVTDISLEQIDASRATPAFVTAFGSPTGTNHRSVHLRPINVYQVRLTSGLRIGAVSGLGYLPIDLKLSNGICYRVSAQYNRVFVDTNVGEVNCAIRPAIDDDKPLRPPLARLRFINRSFGFDAWQDAKSGDTIISDAWSSGSPRVLFRTKMTVIGIAALRAPDAPGADMTLVGDLDGKPAIVTVEFEF